jgi:MerR family transcriptional regulator, copper efflux regulator
VIRQKWLLTPNGMTYTDRQFYHLFGEWNFRALLRTLLATSPTTKETLLASCPDERNHASYLAFLQDQEMLLHTKEGYGRGPALGSIQDIGHTLEWKSACSCCECSLLLNFLHTEKCGLAILGFSRSREHEAGASNSALCLTSKIIGLIALDIPAMGRFILSTEKKEVSLAMDKRHHHQASSLTTLPKAGMTIGELSRLTGFNAKAIRYYEQIGVLPHSSRGDNGYRRYSQADVSRLNLLRRLRLLGISLVEAKSLLVATLAAPCSEVHHELFHLINARLVALDQEIAELYHLREELAGYQQQLADSSVEKGEPFTTCYDQSCLACSPSSSLPQRPVTFVPRGQQEAKTREADPFRAQEKDSGGYVVR